MTKVLESIDNILNFCKGNNSFVSLRTELLLLKDSLKDNPTIFSNEMIIPYKFNNNYKICSNGSILNKSNKKLIPFISNQGYEIVSLPDENGKFKKFSVHRLVTQAFRGEKTKEFVVNHLDGNKINNNINNLIWTTHSENLKHAYLNKLNIPKIGEKHISAKLSDDNVREIRTLINEGLTYDKIATKFNVSRTLIGSIKNKRRRKHD